MKTLITIALLALAAGSAQAQLDSGSGQSAFEQASANVDFRLQDSIAELAALREQMAQEKIELSRKLGELEGELSEARRTYQKTIRALDGSALEVGNLRNEIKARRSEADYLSNLFGEYIRNFETRIHIAEVARYSAVLEEAKLAPERSDLEPSAVFAAQAQMLDVSLGRLDDALGGTKFKGTAVNADGLVKDGMFVLVGPAAIFKSDDAEHAGTAEQRLGSVEPTEIAFASPEDAQAAAQLVSTGEGFFPLDPSLGNAHKFEATNESLLEHVKKGGTVMIPIFIMAATALLVALVKWLGLAFKRKPSRKKINALLDAVERKDEQAVLEAARAVGGVTGKMLTAGAAHLGEPRELIEEVMYESVMTTRLKLNRMLPFIAICAASAPLLGLLGTVTGIINTFKLITVFGSGDVKTLSGGISEALITTEYGLIVAIPSLLLHAFLSRKARAIISFMETSAVAFVNQVSKTYGYSSEDANMPLPGRVSAGNANPNLADLTAMLEASGIHAGKNAMNNGTAGSQAELVRGLTELNQLKAKLEGLGSLDAKLEELGREHQKVSQLVDAGKRELASIKRTIDGASGATSSTPQV